MKFGKARLAQVRSRLQTAPGIDRQKVSRRHMQRRRHLGEGPTARQCVKEEAGRTFNHGRVIDLPP